MKLQANAPYVIVSVCTPETDDPATSGKVINYPCAPTISHDCIELTEEGSYLVKSTFTSRGYVSILDLCRAEKPDPSDPFTGEQKWEKHVKYHTDAQAGKRVGNYPREWLPREVIRRQSCGETDHVQGLVDASRTAPVTSKLTKGKPVE